ncbi:ribosylpyrimidine nucleosidase [Enterococcus florum]|uniref:Ribosylpyrimidine nucleosidase n=1 Tax=Enterococcus florum TaxID=2480627 RepID=A0A4P5PDD8_9ENTE|nr:nucleoside hydrolase [Enterococcus florum]GCF94371.1 ribosylpyrimidine nucleosidase [Enterococcus florum]
MKKIILDLDTGIDDALALAYVLGQEAELIGVTTTFGNVLVERATENTLDLLDLFGNETIPVFEGAAHPWGATKYRLSDLVLRVHGQNGLGNVALPRSKRKKELQTGSQFLIEAAKQYGQDLILVATGPMTNLAEAIQLEKAAIETIGRIVIMGGALTVPGNSTKFAEANIYNDPLAANYVLESGIPVTIVGLDVTLKTLISGAPIRAWKQSETFAGKVMAQMAEYYYTNEYENQDIGGAMHDPLAAAIALDPALATHLLPINLTVETAGVSAGRMIGTLPGLLETEKNAQVCLDIDSDTFISRFVQTVDQVIKQAE